MASGRSQDVFSRQDAKSAQGNTGPRPEGGGWQAPKTLGSWRLSARPNSPATPLAQFTVRSGLRPERKHSSITNSTDDPAWASAATEFPSRRDAETQGVNFGESKNEGGQKRSTACPLDPFCFLLMLLSSSGPTPRPCVSACDVISSPPPPLLSKDLRHARHGNHASRTISWRIVVPIRGDHLSCVHSCDSCPSLFLCPYSGWTYIMTSGLSGSDFQLLEVSNADSEPPGMPGNTDLPTVINLQS